MWKNCSCVFSFGEIHVKKNYVIIVFSNYIYDKLGFRAYIYELKIELKNFFK